MGGARGAETSSQGGKERKDGAERERISEGGRDGGDGGGGECY